jgi:Fur family iron response transcriptional regulator
LAGNGPAEAPTAPGLETRAASDYLGASQGASDAAGQLMQTAENPERCPSRARAAAWLTGAGLRPTRQRLALAELLVGDGRSRHVTAESLHEAARRTGAPVSLATVYNTLRAFCDAGLMHEVTVDGTRSYFDTRTDDHPHYYWEEDGRLTDAPNHAVVLAGAPLLPPGAELSRIDVVIRLRRGG